MKKLSSLLFFFILTVVIVPLEVRSSGDTDLLPGELPEISQDEGEVSVNFSIPSYGTESPAPDVSLSYGEGIAGNFGIRGIQIIERLPNGRYVASGHGELVKTGSVYRSRYDNGIIFEPVGSCSGPCEWRAILPNGITVTMDETILSDGQVIAWGGSRVEDTNGRYYTVSYKKSGAVLYPDRIDYTYTSAGGADRSIQFNYQTRSSRTPQYSHGLRSDYGKVLSSVDVVVQGDTVYTLNLSHTQKNNEYLLTTVGTEIEGETRTRDITVSYTNASNTLTRRQVSTSTGAGKPDYDECNLGAAACLWTQFNAPAPFLVAAACGIYQTNVAAKCETGNTWSVLDLNGDGRSDFLSSMNADSGNGRISVYLDDRDFSSPQIKQQSSISYGMKGSQMPMDINGDGFVDHVSLKMYDMEVPTRYTFLVYYGSQNGFDTNAVELEPPGGMGVGLDKDVLLKRILSFLASQRIGELEEQKNGFGGKVNNSLGMSGGLNSQLKTNKLISAAIGMVQEGNGFMQMADINGDGLPDFVRLMDATTIGVSWGTGSGFTGLVESTVAEGVTDKNRFRQMGDFNGDGIADYYVLVDNGSPQLRVYEGNTQGQFSYQGSYSVNISNVEDAANPEDLLSVNEDDEDVSLVETASSKKPLRILADVNKDGISDFVQSDSDVGLTINFGTGTGLKAAVVSGVAPGESVGRNLVDMNGDGFLDYVRFIKTDEGTYRLYVSYFVENGFEGTDYLDFEHANGKELNGRFVYYDDVNGDGRADIVAPDEGRIEVFFTATTPVNHIKTVTDGTTSIAIGYGRSLNEITSPAASKRVGGKGGYSILADTRARFLVKNITVSGRSGEKAKTAYSYKNSLMRVGPSKMESRPIGMKEITERSYAYSEGSWNEGPTYKVTTNYHNHPDLGYDGGGLPEKTVVYASSNDALLSQQSPEFKQPSEYTYTGTAIKVARSGQLESDSSTNRTLSQQSSVTAYDAYGNPTEMSETDTETGEVKVTEIQYDYPSAFPNGLPARSIVRRSGEIISYEEKVYDGKGNVLSEESGPDTVYTVTKTYTYDSDGNVLAETSNGLTTTYEYDKSGGGQPVKVKNPDGTTVSIEYDAHGRKIKETDPTGRVTSYSYDTLGRKTKTEISAPGMFSSSHNLESVSYEFDDASGEMAVVTDRAMPGDQRSVLRSVTDEWNREVHKETLNTDGIISVDTEYDNLDRPVASTVPYRSVPGEKVRTYYDSLGRVIRTESPGPAGTLLQETDPGTLYRASFTATGSGRALVGYAIEQTKPNGQKVYEYKSGDRPVQTEYQTSVSVDGSTPGIVWNRIRYHYDYNDRLIAITRGTGSSRDSITDNPALTSTIEYNGFGQKIAVYDPDKGTTQYSYDGDHRPLCTEYPDGKVTCNKYDAYGRVIALYEGGLDGNQIAEYRYGESASAFSEGKLSYVKDDTGEMRFHYDALTGKPSKIERTYTVSGVTKQFDIELAYDTTGALLRRKFPQTGLALYYIYHPDGSLKELQLEDEKGYVVEGGGSATVLTTDTPDALGLSPAVHYGNGVSIEAERNEAGFLTRMTASGADGIQAQYSFVYNSEGMILAKLDELQTGGIDRSETFTYDITRRLIEAQGPYGTAASPAKTMTYRYGFDGQPSSINGSSVTYSTDNAHRMKSAGEVSYRYDIEDGAGRGLVTRRHQSDNIQTEYTYNWQGRLSAVRNITPEGEIRSEFTYDSEGNRFYRSSQYDGETIETYDLSNDYRIHTEGDREYHTLEVQNNGQRIARFRFIAYHHTAMAPASSDLYLARAGVALQQIAYLDHGLSNLPLLFAVAGENAFFAVKYLEINWIQVAYLIFASSGLAALFMLLVSWYRAGWFANRTHPDFAGNVPSLLIRLTSLLLVITMFSLSSCIGNNGGQDLIIPPGGGGRFSSSSGGNSDATLIGAYYYTSTHNGSTDLVTDSSGKVIARFAYDPFGNVVEELTDLDPDGNKEFYKGTFYFTGQEFETETGLYNYKARTYDPKTGRFLQPDPVHTDKAGMDNFDRYQYAWNNPVNFNDPDGKKAKWTFDALAKPLRIGLDRANNTIQRITRGKKYNDSHNTINVAAKKMREAGTFVRRMFTSSKNFLTALWGVMDFMLSGTVNAFRGRKTWVSYHNGGFVVHNSVGAEVYGASHAGGLSGHLEYGDSKAKLKHEVSHIHQSLHGGGWGNWDEVLYPINEYDNDFRGLTADYGGMFLIYKMIFPEELYRTVLFMNGVYGDDESATMYWFSTNWENTLLSQQMTFDQFLQFYTLIGVYTNSQREFLGGLL